MSSLLEDISIRFENVRKELGYNFSQLAKILDTTHVNLSKIAAMKSTPNLQIIANMIDKLNVSPAYLFYGIGPVHNKEWDTLLNRGRIEKEVLNKLQNVKETQFYKTIFSALSTSTNIQTFLHLFFKKVHQIIVEPDGAKQKLIDLLVDLEKEYKNPEPISSNSRYLSKKDKEEAIDYIVTNFDDDEAYFLLKNAKKVQREIKVEMN